MVGTALTGASGQNRAAQQGRAGIEAAAGVTNHPTALPPAGIRRTALRFDLQCDRAQLIAPAAQLIAVVALHHQIAPIRELQPTAGVGHFVQLEPINQLVAAGLPQFDAHRS